MSCCAKDCNNSQSVGNGNNNFSFPKTNKLYKIWAINVGREDLIGGPKPWRRDVYLCQNHFRTEDIEVRKSGKKKLENKAVPIKITSSVQILDTEICDQETAHQHQPVSSADNAVQSHASSSGSECLPEFDIKVDGEEAIKAFLRSEPNIPNIDHNKKAPGKITAEKKKRYLPKYTSAIGNDALFKDWIRKSCLGDHFAYCSYCCFHLKLSGGRLDLIKHSRNKKHLNNVPKSKPLSFNQEDSLVSPQIKEAPSIHNEKVLEIRYQVNHSSEEELNYSHIESEPDIPMQCSIEIDDKTTTDPSCCFKSSKDQDDKLFLKSVLRKKKRYSQKYSLSIQNDPLFTEWVERSHKGDVFAYCKYCEIHLKLSGGRTDLVKHSKKAKHVANMKKPKTTLRNVIVSSFHNKSNECDVRLAAFIAEHNLPLTAADRLPQLIRDVCSDSKIAQNITCTKTKARMLIDKVISEEYSEMVVKNLTKYKFSLIVDESTNKCFEKHLSLVVKILVDNSVKDFFLDLIPLKDATPEIFYNRVIAVFKKSKIPYKVNMIGFAADGGNSLLIGPSSFSSHLKAEIPHLFIMKSICNSFALCASQACLKLPQELEDLSRDIFCYFNSSTKLLNGFEAEFKDFIIIKPSRLLHPSQTRWLSLHIVVSKLLEHYDSLKLYFNNAIWSDNLTAPVNIMQNLNNPLTRLYLLFLDFILPILNDLNKLMQSEISQIYNLHKSVIITLSKILKCYMLEGYLRTASIGNIDVKNSDNFKSLDELYFGDVLGLEIKSLTVCQLHDIKSFRINCLEFLIEAASEVYKRISFDLEPLIVLNPHVVIKKEVSSLANLVTHFEYLTIKPEAVSTEWKHLIKFLDILEADSCIDMKPEEFWTELSTVKKMGDSLMFPNLSKFMLLLLCLPHSTIKVEGIFSFVNKTMIEAEKDFSIENLVGLLRTKEFMKGQPETGFPVSNSLLERAKNLKNSYESNDIKRVVSYCAPDK